MSFTAEFTHFSNPGSAISGYTSVDAVSLTQRVTASALWGYDATGGAVMAPRIYLSGTPTAVASGPAVTSGGVGWVRMPLSAPVKLNPNVTYGIGHYVSSGGGNGGIGSQSPVCPGGLTVNSVTTFNGVGPNANGNGFYVAGDAEPSNASVIGAGSGYAMRMEFDVPIGRRGFGQLIAGWRGRGVLTF